MKFSIYIAARYLLAKKSRNAINVISAVSVAGVTVGTMALIIVLSVFNGLENMINHIFTVFDPGLRITAAEGKVFTPDSLKLVRLSQIQGIESFSQTLEENSLLKYGERQYIATLKGVDESYSTVTDVDNTIIEGEFRLRSPGGRPETIVGAGVAEYLGININFITPLHIFVPRRKANANIDPENAFNDKHISPSGIYQIEHGFDSKYYFVPIDFARELLEYDNEVSAIDVRINSKAKPDLIQDEVKKLFGSNFIVQNRFEQKEIFYKVMRAERLAIFIILTLILVIASFNIIGSLTMLIIEKERDITILRSLGADNTLIRKIFLLEGWLISLTGAIAGIILGFLICMLQQKYGIVKLQSETLILNVFPVAVKLKDFIIVPATVLLIGFMAAWYPVRYLSRKYLRKGENGRRSFPSAQRTISLLVIILTLISSSCVKRKTSIKKSEAIPQEKLVTLLTDLYITDGLLSYPRIKHRFLEKDSILNYIDVIHAHGYSKEDLDRTLEYYFMRNPKRLEKIHDQVIARLSETLSRIEAEEETALNPGLWNQKSSFDIPRNGMYNKIWFSIPVSDTGIYTFVFDALVFPDDESINLRTNIFFWRADSTKEGVRDYWEPSYFIRDGKTHSYTFSNYLADTSFTHIQGWLLEHDNRQAQWKKHVKINRIRVFRKTVE